MIMLFSKRKEPLFLKSDLKGFKKSRNNADATRLEIIKNSPERYENVLQDIHDTIGIKNVGEYDSTDVIKYVRKKYAVKTISAYDLFYLMPNNEYSDAYKVRKPIKKITDGRVCDEDCIVIYSLPKYRPSPAWLIGKSDCTNLVLGAKNDKISSWWIGLNNTGYTDLGIALYIFCGKNYEDICKL